MTCPANRLGLKDGQRQRVIGFLCLPLKPSPLHFNQEDSVGNLVSGRAIGGA